MLSHKYRGQRRSSTNLLNITSYSPIRAGIKKGEDTISKGAKWIAGSNNGLSLWYDKWLDTGTLRSRIYGPLNKGEEDNRLKDVASFFGWKWEGLSFDFPKSIMLEMKATLIPFSNQREDRLSWGLSPSGDFKLKDAYHIANANDPKPINWPYSEEWIWKIPTLPKIKFFLWQCSHDSIPVRVLLANKGINISLVCPACNSAPETIIHALRDCPKAQSFWNSFSPPCSATSFYDTQLMVWLRINCKSIRQCNATELDWGYYISHCCLGSLVT